MRHTLQALQARAQAATALADGGPASLVQTLTGLLPPLANSGESPKGFCCSITSPVFACIHSIMLLRVTCESHQSRTLAHILDNYSFTHLLMSGVIGLYTARCHHAQPLRFLMPFYTRVQQLEGAGTLPCMCGLDNSIPH